MSRAQEIALWIEDRFSERSERIWSRSELICFAWKDGIDLELWRNAPEVRAVGLKEAIAEIYPGKFSPCFVLDPTLENLTTVDLSESEPHPLRNGRPRPWTGAFSHYNLKPESRKDGEGD